MKQESKFKPQVLIDFRTALGVNMSEFARTANIDIALYSRIEKGTVNPGYKTLMALICTYSIDPNILFQCNKEGDNNGGKKAVKNRRK